MKRHVKNFIFFISLLMNFLIQKMAANSSKTILFFPKTQINKNFVSRVSGGILKTSPYDPCPWQKHLNLYVINLEATTSPIEKNPFYFYLNSTFNFKTPLDRRNFRRVGKHVNFLEAFNFRLGGLYDCPINKTLGFKKVIFYLFDQSPFKQNAQHQNGVVYSNHLNGGLKLSTSYFTFEGAIHCPIASSNEKIDGQKVLHFSDIGIFSKNFKLFRELFLTLFGNVKIIEPHPSVWYFSPKSKKSTYTLCPTHSFDCGFSLHLNRYGKISFSEFSSQGCNIQYSLIFKAKHFQPLSKEDFWPAPLNISIFSCDCNARGRCFPEYAPNHSVVFEKELDAALFSKVSRFQVINLLKQNKTCSHLFLQANEFEALSNHYGEELLEWVTFQSIFSKIPELQNLWGRSWPEKPEFEEIKRILLENRSILLKEDEDNGNALLLRLFSNLFTPEQRKSLPKELQSSSPGTEECGFNVLMRLLGDHIPGHYWYDCFEIEPTLTTSVDCNGFSIWHYLFFHRIENQVIDFDLKKYDEFLIHYINTLSSNTQYALKTPWAKLCYLYASTIFFKHDNLCKKSDILSSLLLENAENFESLEKDEPFGKIFLKNDYHEFQMMLRNLKKNYFNRQYEPYEESNDYQSIFFNYFREFYNFRGKKKAREGFFDAFEAPYDAHRSYSIENCQSLLLKAFYSWLTTVGNQDSQEKFNKEFLIVNGRANQYPTKEIFKKFVEKKSPWFIYPDMAPIKNNFNHPATTRFIRTFEKVAREKKEPEINIHYVFTLRENFLDKLKKSEKLKK